MTTKDIRTNLPSVWELPKFIIMECHDGEGNPRTVKFIHEEAIERFIVQVTSSLNSLNNYKNDKWMGGDTK